ncbi:AraC family transcriptional regulator [Paeniglutamicibacter gangotriensis]|uniref:L-rhamnose operon regulatory protein rhaS n=1 Tax=Paeniglutamicibacter gangotriensis Lz1y TaxID=1276920 RepID=M7NJ27_9MICC|nr:AraC family transcriptional regulator [Paeniglutamicibacter gangotriensis]EMQ98563.1 L-rhamnose operon regulatory protein rhaS [Paeniglutamicibacter gangotriensis Lz1y]
MLSQQHAIPSAIRVLDALPTLQTPDPIEAQERISQLFCPHTLRPLSSRGTVKLNLRSTGTGFGVHLLDYGTAVRISPGALETFFMVQVPLAGSAQLHSSGSVVESTPTVASIPPIDDDFSMTWQAGTPQLIVTAPRELLNNAASALYGAKLEAPLKLAKSMNIDTPEGQSFMRAVFEYHDVVNTQGAAQTPYARRLHEELVLARWLMAAKSNFSAALAQWEAPVEETRSSPLVMAFTDLLEIHSEEDLSVGDLAEALGVSIRTLQVALAKELGSTPSQMLREARLVHAHALLTDADPRTDSVTSIAERCGFGHLGRFAQSYRRHFGFPPSQTLRGSSR